MKNLRIAAIVLGLLTVLPAFGLAQSVAGTLRPRDATASHPWTEADTQTLTASTNATVHATKGVVKFVDANTLVIKRTPQDGRETTLVLNPSTQRSGDVKVGSTVDVRYRTEAKQRVATAVTVVHARQPSSAPGSHK
jgi:hypothetical protein